MAAALRVRSVAMVEVVAAARRAAQAEVPRAQLTAASANWTAPGFGGASRIRGKLNNLPTNGRETSMPTITNPVSPLHPE
jgi:hypothetical protein